MKNNIVFSIIVLLVLVFATIIPNELCWPFIIIFAGFLAGIVLISFAEAQDREVLFTIFAGAFFLRIIFSQLLFNISFWMRPEHGFFIHDGYSFHYTGSWMASMWRLGVFPDKFAISDISMTNAFVSPYDYWCGFVYFITGNNPISLFFINSVMGSITVILVYFISKRIFDSKVAVVASLFIAFWPSLILWSTQNLKEPSTIFFVTVCLLAFTSFKHRLRFSYLLFFAASFFILLWLRQLFAAIVVFSIAMSMFFSLKKRIVFLLLVIVLSTFFLINLYGSDFLLVKAKSWFAYNVGISESFFESVDYARQVRTAGASSAFFRNVDISSFSSAVAFLPIGLIFVFLSPFPWQTASIEQVFAIPEMLVWYALLPLTFLGVYRALKNKRKDSLLLIIFISTVVLIMSFLEGNVGTIFRHRSIILGFTFVFTAAGITQKRIKLK